ncbi:unnamed protein product, partial [marine sediment metagenome]
MARPKPWLKMWTEWVHDPKMLNLTLAEQGAWWRVVSLAHECNAGGGLVKGNGAPLTIKEIAKTLYMTAPEDFEVMKSMNNKMVEAGSLAWNHGILTVIHLNDRQEMMPSETPEARRNRVRLYRERQAGIPVTEKSLHEPIIAEISKLHEQYFGIITPVLAEKFKDFVENYHGPVEWINLAFAEAVKYKNRRWKYVEAILYSWQEKGGPHADRGRGDKGEQPGADQRDPLASYREQGWEVLGDEEPEA